MKAIEAYAEQLDNVVKDTAIAKIVGTVAGGIVTVFGLIMAPLTSGASLSLSALAAAAPVLIGKYRNIYITKLIVRLPGCPFALLCCPQF